MELVRLPAFRDNYLWLLRCPETGAVAVVDPGDDEVVDAALRARGWGLDLILNTHHHADHVGGNLALAAAYGARILGPAGEQARIPGLTQALQDGQQIRLGARQAQVLGVPGHTLGHIAFHFPASEGAAEGLLFCGDSLFLMGCGRLFEGSPAMLWDSLRRLRALPDATLVCCAHEYTLGNARFACSVLPQDPEIAARAEQVQAMRARDQPTVPDLLGREKRTNVFLRADEPELALALFGRSAPPVEVLAELRARKDRF